MSKSNQVFSRNPAPKDGTVILARGRVIGPCALDEDDISGREPVAIGTVSEPFEELIRWESAEDSGDGLAGWRWHGSGLSVAQTLEDRVYIDEWHSLMPCTKRSGLTIHELHSRQHRSQMRAFALKFRAAIHTGSWHGNLGQRGEDGVRQLEHAMNYRSMASSSLANGMSFAEAA